LEKNYVNRLCKSWTAVSEIRLMVVHAWIGLLLRIELLKNIFFCMIQGSYVPNLVKIGPQITSQSCPRTSDRQTDVYVILYSVHSVCIALDRQKADSHVS